MSEKMCCNCEYYTNLNGFCGKCEEGAPMLKSPVSYCSQFIRNTKNQLIIQRIQDVVWEVNNESKSQSKYF